MVSRALIPAAGRGFRAYPKSKHTPKVLLPVDGKPIVQCVFHQSVFFHFRNFHIKTSIVCDVNFSEVYLKKWMLS